MKLPIYMDHHATTPVDPRVVDAMLPYFTTKFGNAASRNHVFGWEAEDTVDEARESIAALIGATEKEIIFTSGATESDNLAIKGVAGMYREQGNHVITCRLEHKAVLDTCKRLETEGCEVTYLDPTPDGLVTAEMVRAAITPKTILVALMYGNNEIGTLNPMAEIGAVCKEKGVVFFTDATQAAGHVPVDVEKMGVDLLACTAHKMYGPKGCGALYVRRKKPRVRLTPIIDGGGHERGMRSGTLNVPGIVGFGAAARLAAQEMHEEAKRLAGWRDRMARTFLKEIDYAKVNGSMDRRLPGNLNISFPFVEGESLMMGIKDIAVSSGSACTSASLEPSYVLKALGVGDELAHSAIRFGLGRFNTEEEVEFVV
ncbi:MAG: IscS subfamily cysteine desulfurase, partial [Planctomycetes bacterium]|nr:IscS subfamily cysteine desulfurase [Planctomycetota bacterium]